MSQFVSSKNSKSAKRYAKALIELASKDVSFDKIYFDMNFIIGIISKNPDLANFLETPVISKNDKKDVLEKIFLNRVCEPVLNFLFLLNENSRLNILDDICASFKEYLDEEKNILNVYVTSCVELSYEQKNALKTKLEARLGKNINTEYNIQNSVLGGLIIKINDTVIDLSLKKRIENLKKI